MKPDLAALLQKAEYIVEHRHELGDQSPWFVPDVRYSVLESIAAVASGQKPFTRLVPDLPNVALSESELMDRLQEIIVVVRTQPRQVTGIEYWINKNDPQGCCVLYGQKVHYQLYKMSESLADMDEILLFHTVRGLSFGYPEEKIASFLLRLEKLLQINTEE